MGPGQISESSNGVLTKSQEISKSGLPQIEYLELDRILTVSLNWPMATLSWASPAARINSCLRYAVTLIPPGFTPCTLLGFTGLDCGMEPNTAQ